MIRHALSRNCLPKHIIEGKVEGKTEEKIEEDARGGRRGKQLLNDLKGKILETERSSIPYSTARKNRCRRIYGLVARQNKLWRCGRSPLRLLGSQKEILSRNYLLYYIFIYVI